MKRNSPQNALYWALLHEIADKVRPGGLSYSAEQFHAYYKSRFLGCDDIALPNGKTLLMPRSTAALSTEEFSSYYAAVEADAAERGVYLADLEDAS